MKKKRSISLKTRDSLVGTLFMSPWLIGLLVFTLIPFIYSVWLSLCSVEFGPDGMQTAFVGGRWYKEIFSADAYFLQALKDTLQFIVLFMPMILVVAIICFTAAPFSASCSSSRWLLSAVRLWKS